MSVDKLGSIKLVHSVRVNKSVFLRGSEFGDDDDDNDRRRQIVSDSSAFHLPPRPPPATDHLRIFRFACRRVRLLIGGPLGSPSSPSRRLADITATFFYHFDSPLLAAQSARISRKFAYRRFGSSILLRRAATSSS